MDSEGFLRIDGNPTCALARPTIMHHRGCLLIHILFKPHSAHGFEHPCFGNERFFKAYFRDPGRGAYLDLRGV